ncbi:putative uridine kinase [Tanacetum coccineum]
MKTVASVWGLRGRNQNKTPTESAIGKTVAKLGQETSTKLSRETGNHRETIGKTETVIEKDPKEAHARRGAPWTFNPDLFLKCLKTLREQGSVYAPSFDHGVGDPVEDDIFVNVQHKVVIVEGNYLLLEYGTWKEVSSMFDEKWFVDVDIDIAMERVLKRHIGTGNTPELAKQRIEYNDRPNAELVCKSKKNADLIIKSIAL